MASTVQTVTSNVLVTLAQNAILTMEHVGAPWALLASGVVRVRYVNIGIKLKQMRVSYLCSHLCFH